jgi:dTMP kinase
LKAKYIVVEGLEGAGKTSAIHILSQTLSRLGVNELKCVREPGGTPLAESIRQLVKHHQDPTDPMTEMSECLLMYAARSQLVNNVIRPQLAEGIWVIGDRHDLSSRAYQGGGRQLSGMVDNLSTLVLGDFKPDLTLYLDIKPSVGLQRAQARGQLDRIEQESHAFFERTRDRYVTLVEADPQAVLIDANQPLKEVHQQVIEVVEQQFEQWQC